MMSSVALVLLWATEAEPPTTTMPRRYDVPTSEAPRENRPAEQTEGRDHPGAVTDYLFDRPLTATDDPAFITSVVVGTRQGALAAREAGSALQSAPLREAAEKIGRQNEDTARALETLARKKGWTLPERTAGSGMVARSSPARVNADFIINQIAFHEATVDQFRAQIAGDGDAELKRALRSALPGYQRNLELLLTLKP
jgi:predicted outer membrane protein